MKKVDVVIVGAGFAGLACGKKLAEKGRSVVIVERKKIPQQSTHTTGIFVKEAFENLSVPRELVREISGVRLYSPSLKHIEIQSSDYFFMATDTPELMSHFSKEAQKSGVQVLYNTPYSHAYEKGGEIILEEQGLACDYLIGSDGLRSCVARDFNLGTNEKFLAGVEAEFSEADLPDPNAFYCFLNNQLAHGYLGWVVPSVGIVQVGLATSMPVKPNIQEFIDHVGPLFSLDSSKIVSRRGGLIPVGGVVKPFSKGNVILLGDAAGTVSPLTAGGIHMAMHYGEVLADAIVRAKGERRSHPSAVLKKSFPRFYMKHALRWGLEKLAPNWLLNFVLGNAVFQRFAEIVFFRKKRLRVA